MGVTDRDSEHNSFLHSPWFCFMLELSSIYLLHIFDTVKPFPNFPTVYGITAN